MAEIMGHRGARSECKENTMEAFQRAVELDACGIESDVHMLFDGSLVMYHDAVIPETTDSLYMFDGEYISSQIKDIVFFEEFLQAVEDLKRTAGNTACASADENLLCLEFKRFLTCLAECRQFFTGTEFHHASFTSSSSCFRSSARSSEALSGVMAG